jgi:hypothetical protein
MAFVPNIFTSQISIVLGILASFRRWLTGSSSDPDSSTAAILGCAYLLLVSLADSYAGIHQVLPLVVANIARALIMLLILALLVIRRYLGSFLYLPCRWMFITPAVLATFEATRNIGSMYRTHAIASAIIACIALTFAFDLPICTSAWITARRVRWLCIAGLVSVALVHVPRTHNPFFAYPSIDAITALSQGLNPYRVDLDPDDQAFSNTSDERFKSYFAFGNTRVERFRGYKYSPLLPIIYFPAVWMLGGKVGVLITNSIILVLTASILPTLCWQFLGSSGMWVSMLLLASPLVTWYVLVVQANDLVPVLPMCVAFLVWNNRPGVAGLLLGVSASIKVMPAPLAMALLLPADLSMARRFVAGIAAGLVPTIAFVVWDPSAFFNNVVLFEIVRPNQPDSLLYDVSPTVVLLLRGGFVAIFLATAAAALAHRWSIVGRMTAYVALTIGVLLTSQLDMDNYWLWWIPFFIPLLCRGGVARASATSEILRRGHVLAAS